MHLITVPIGMAYSREQLLSIRDNLDTTIRLPPAALSQIRWYGLNEIPATIRGSRGGRNIQRPISVLASSNSKSSTRRTHSRPNLGNLSKIKQILNSNVKAGLLNCRSVKNKSDLIVYHIMDSGLDILALTETWLASNDSDNRVIGNLTPPGYTFHHVPRSSGKGGGVG